MQINAHLRCAVASGLWFFCSAGAAQSEVLWRGLSFGSHVVGFSTSVISDPNRSYRDGTARKIQVATWYPARVGTVPMTLGRYARELTFDVERGGPEPLAQLSIGEEPGLSVEKFERLAAMQTTAYWTAPAAVVDMPTVLLAPGLHYESPVHLALLAEYLASYGYTVVAAPLSGTHSPLAQLTSEDLQTFIDDLRVARASSSRGREAGYAIVGFDLGGIAGFQIARTDARVRALISLESGIAAPTLMSRLVAPGAAVSQAHLLHVTRPADELRQRGLEEDLTTANESFNSTAVVRLSNFRHADFTLAGFVENVEPGFWGAPPGQPQDVLPVVFDIARQFLSDAFGNRATDPDIALPATVTIEINAGEASLPFDEFVNRLLVGETLYAPHNVTQAAFDRLSEELLFRRQRPDLLITAIEVIEHGDRLIEVDEAKGDALQLLNRPSDAVAAYERARSRSPSSQLDTKLAHLRVAASRTNE